MENKDTKAIITAKSLTKSNVWDLSENDILIILENASHEIDIESQFSRLVSIIKLAFDVDDINPESTIQRQSFEKRGFQIINVQVSAGLTLNWALKKRALQRVTDLTYQNVSHISAQKLLSVIESNFGGGWESLSQSIKDVILSGFLVSSTTMPKSRNVEDSALYKKKIADGFDVLLVEKGSWYEVIFAKLKEVIVKDDEPLEEKPERRRRSKLSVLPEGSEENDEDMDDEELDELDGDMEDDDDDYNEDELTAESYRTVVDEDPEDLDVNSIEESDDDY